VYFRSHVLGCALFFNGNVIVVAELDGCAEIRQLQLAQIGVAHQQDILWLQISASSGVRERGRIMNESFLV